MWANWLGTGLELAERLSLPTWPSSSCSQIRDRMRCFLRTTAARRWWQVSPDFPLDSPPADAPHGLCFNPRCKFLRPFICKQNLQDLFVLDQAQRDLLAENENRDQPRSVIDELLVALLHQITHSNRSSAGIWIQSVDPLMEKLNFWEILIGFALKCEAPLQVP